MNALKRIQALENAMQGGKILVTMPDGVKKWVDKLDFICTWVRWSFEDSPPPLPYAAVDWGAGGTPNGNFFRWVDESLKGANV